MLLKAVVQLFHDNQQDSSVYQNMNEVVVPQLASLLTSYRTDSLVVRPLIDLIACLSFPTLESIERLVSLLMDLFESESDWSEANQILSIVTHLHVTMGESTQELVTQALHKTTSHVLEPWKQLEEAMNGRLEELDGGSISKEGLQTSRRMSVLMHRLNCLFSFCDVRKELKELGVPSTAEVLIQAIKPSFVETELIELRFCCLKLKQMECLYELLHAKQPDIQDSFVNEEVVVRIRFCFSCRTHPSKCFSPISWSLSRRCFLSVGSKSTKTPIRPPSIDPFFSITSHSPAI